VRAWYTAHGRVRIELPYEYTTERHVDGRTHIQVQPAEWDELAEQIRSGDAEKEELRRGLEAARDEVQAMSLKVHHFKRSADDALEQIKRLSDERDEAVAVREGVRDLLRREKERADAAIERESVAEEAYDELAEELERHRVHLRLAGEEIRRRKPESVSELRFGGVPFVIPQEPRVYTDTDMVTEEEAAHIVATAPVGSLVDDLKNTIVSQAREIARLKGESV